MQLGLLDFDESYYKEQEELQRKEFREKQFRKNYKMSRERWIKKVEQLCYNHTL